MKSLVTFCLALAAGGVITSLPVSAQVAPAWDLPSINGPDINSTNFAGQVVVLNFWATWCGPCCDELPSLIALQQNYASNGMTVVGISLDDSPDGINPPTALVSATAASYGLNYPVVMDSPGNVADSLYGTLEYGPGGYIEFIPNTFIIDRQNNIVQTFVGEQTYETYESTIVPLLTPIVTNAPPPPPVTVLPVHLSVTIGNGQVHLTWPVTPSTYAVQSTGDLSSGVWTVETGPILSDGAYEFSDVPTGPAQQFFRLQLQ
jgi:thiol-disulfide isomerase/thioredoxin